jgi:methylenetetrahydrofolate--tRNA-(uracil-5-)-methyltransferase
MLGALCHYISHTISHTSPEGYQPTNAAFGLLPEAPRGIRKKRDRRLARSERALAGLERWIEQTGERPAVESAP